MKEVQVMEICIFLLRFKRTNSFKREENLFCEIPISITTAILGGEIEVPTIEGKKPDLIFRQEHNPRLNLDYVVKE